MKMRNSERNEVKLGDIAEYANERIDIGELNITNYTSTENMLPNKGGKTLASSLPSKGTVMKVYKGQTLISNIRPYFKKIWFADSEGGCSSDVLVFKLKNEIDEKYFYYHLSQDSFFDYVMAGSKGTKMPRGDKQQILMYSFKLPPLQEQKIIANILSNIDKKIETNNQINEKLEEMAQSIFKQWFVEFEFPNEDGEPYKSSGGEMIESELGMVPKGWRYGEICDVAKRIYSGGTPKTSEESYWNGDLPWMSSGETRNNFVISTDKNISKLGAEKSSTKLAYKYNTVIASAGQGFTRGQTSLLLIDTYINQSLITIESKKDYEFFNYLNIKSRYNELRSISDSHSIRGSLTTKMIGSLSIIIPAEVVANQFSNLVFLIINKIENNIKEIDRLIKIRDLLLPKLMSGEIIVPINN